MLNCKEATELMSQAQVRPLGRVESLRLRLHLLLCRGCRSFNAQMAFLRRATARRGNPPKEP